MGQTKRKRAIAKAKRIMDRTRQGVHDVRRVASSVQAGAAVRQAMKESGSAAARVKPYAVTENVPRTKGGQIVAYASNPITFAIDSSGRLQTRKYYSSPLSTGRHEVAHLTGAGEEVIGEVDMEQPGAAAKAVTLQSVTDKKMYLRARALSRKVTYKKVRATERPTSPAATKGKRGTLRDFARSLW